MIESVFALDEFNPDPIWCVALRSTILEPSQYFGTDFTTGNVNPVLHLLSRCELVDNSLLYVWQWNQFAVEQYFIKRSGGEKLQIKWVWPKAGSDKVWKYVAKV